MASEEGQKEGGHFKMTMNYKDVENKLKQRIENAKKHRFGEPVLFALEATLADLQKAMYDPENPESTANSLGKCSRCGQLLPRGQNNC